MQDESADKGIVKTAVLNAGDQASVYFAGLTAARVVAYGPAERRGGPSHHEKGGDVRATDVTAAGWGSRFELHAPGSKRDVRLAVPGGFNVENALAATAIGIAAGLSLEDIVTGLESWPGAPGRMERVDAGQPFTVIVDFAHSPDSLRRVLELLREKSRGRIIAVFGCIGERDRDRRPGMARAAAELADYTFVTDDNPYSEDRDEILEDIAAGMRDAGKREGHDFAVVPDRRQAIAQALTMAVDEDAVLLAGKGHEREVHLGATEYACDDREVSRAVLGEMGYGDSG
jgi:UDP-N-acetylmuramoyl-L-alanyl-D-glutamate--2,6-diaminopimelate ligase